MQLASALLIIGLLTPIISAQEPKCSILHLIHARGTMEAKGYGAAGTSLVAELKKLIPDITTYPVNYPADWSGCKSETAGVTDILQHINTMSQACPQQKYVLSGHSQGAVITTSSIPKIPKDLNPRLLAITMFGAPPCLAEVKEKCKSYCNAGDDICAGTSNPKSNGLCNGPKSARLWTGARNVTEEMERLREVNSADQVETLGEADAAEECSNADVPEKGHQVSGFAKSYNKDAFYTKAAACYIYKKLKSSTS